MKKRIGKFLQNRQLVILAIVYLISRLINLTKIPIFNDESIYLDWGWKSLHTGAGLFYSLYDAKPPLLIWIFGIAESLVSSPLFMGRLVSVLAGLLSLIGIYKLAKSLEGHKIAILASVFYIFIPLFVFFDRQALMESAITATGIWSFYFLLKSLDNKKLKYPILLGLILGTGIFIKLQALVFLVSILIVLIYKKHIKSAVVVLSACLLVLAPLLSQKSFWDTANMNSRFMLSIPEILRLPFSVWFKNISTTFGVSFFHLTPFVFLLGVFGIYLFFKDKNYIFPSFFLINMIFIILLGKSLSTRYIVAFLPLVTIFSSKAVYSFKKPLMRLVGGITLLVATVATVMLVFFPLIYFNLLDGITTTSQKPEYVTDWTSGYGLPEVVKYLKSKGLNTQIIVGVRLDAGNPESAIFTYFNNSKWIYPKYLDARLVDPAVLESKCLNSSIPIYFIARDGILAGLDKFFQEVKRFEKPESIHFISIHTLKPCN